MSSNKHKEALAKTPKSVKIFVSKSMDVLDRIHDLLKRKGWTQKELADKLGKTEEWVSRVLHGVQNFTLKTISELEAVFEEPIIVVMKHEELTSAN